MARKTLQARCRFDQLLVVWRTCQRLAKSLSWAAEIAAPPWVFGLWRTEENNNRACPVRFPLLVCSKDLL
ncbi:MAG: hypothetical protein K2X80_11385 [Pseudomonadaceae bacterium]|nr:hypothetical protein [Pseudomonadaceae bacterium]